MPKIFLAPHLTKCRWDTPLLGILTLCATRKYFVNDACHGRGKLLTYVSVHEVQPHKHCVTKELIPVRKLALLGASLHFIKFHSSTFKKKWLITKTIGIVSELFASPMLFVCFIRVSIERLTRYWLCPYHNAKCPYRDREADVYHRNVKCYGWDCYHYNDVIMTMMASQITSLTVVYSMVYSGADQRKRQSSASLAFVRGIPRIKGQ